ncbi:unnamed protein product [Sphenostylis stenocarpa]|uniref:Uncharacterized protein n=1 Tax=Sphenostylis stenocarpa TaxID=92480 RepID=A0AA86SFA9_9FABA|nr:unnamed protein product [Sphenostylis stenocarpa]
MERMRAVMEEIRIQATHLMLIEVGMVPNKSAGSDCDWMGSTAILKAGQIFEKMGQFQPPCSEPNSFKRQHDHCGIMSIDVQGLYTTLHLEYQLSICCILVHVDLAAHVSPEQLHAASIRLVGPPYSSSDTLFSMSRFG